MGWKKVGGRTFWDPDVAHSPEEAAEAKARVDEMNKAAKPAGARVWRAESTIQATGHAMDEATWNAWKKEHGYVEVDKGDTNVRQPPKPTKADIARDAVLAAKEFLAKTGQLPERGIPITEETKAKAAAGLPIIRMPAADGSDMEEGDGDPEGDPEPTRVRDRSGRRVPWGYAGSKDDLIAAGKAAAQARHEASEDTSASVV